MNWWLDQGLPRSTASLLRDAGHDAVHVGDRGMAAASDEEIIGLAQAETRIVVTLDADFHSILAKSGATKPSVIRIREEGLKAVALSRLILQIAESFSEPLSMGCVLTILNNQVRHRRLPLNP